MDTKPKTSLTPSQWLLAIGAFLLPLLGGQINTDKSLPLGPGAGSLLTAMFGGPIAQGFEVPFLTHFAIAAVFALALILSLAKREIVQIPNVRLMGLLIAFFGLIGISIGLSSFRLASFGTISEFLCYAMALFTSVAVAGRRDGPRLVATALFVGAAILALIGIGLEYREMRAIDPNHRIFIGWVNPNATAGILTIGFLVGLAIQQVIQGSTRILAGVALVLILVALFLTGSKAGFAAALVGAVVWMILTLLWRIGEKKLQVVGTCIAVLLLGFGLFTAMQRANAGNPASAAPLGRVASFSDSQAQSLGFRKLLWSGAVQAWKDHPVGFGAGTYRYEGSRAGLTTQTQLAHNNLVQLLIETSPIGAVLFAVIVGWWLYLMFRGARNMPAESNSLRAGIVAAVVATFAQGIFESNLYYFGIGMCLFLLMGLGTNLSADSVLPEFTPRSLRACLAGLAIIPLIGLAYVGYGELQRARIAYEIANRNFEEARALSQGLASVSPSDGENLYLLSKLDPEHGLDWARRAAEVQPTPKILRGLAQAENEDGRGASSEAAINGALVRDPNNLNTLGLGLDLAKKRGDNALAKSYAERMVAVERTPYFQIRSLPELIETATADARRYLADSIADPKQRVAMLEPALEIYVKYAEVTVPQVIRFGKENMDFAGETAEVAIGNCQRGASVARRLIADYRALGATDKSTSAEGGLRTLEEALASLGGNK